MVKQGVLGIDNDTGKDVEECQEQPGRQHGQDWTQVCAKLGFSKLSTCHEPLESFSNTDCQAPLQRLRLRHLR